MQKRRFHDRHEHRLQLLIPTRADPSLVLCPRCRQMAQVLPAPSDTSSSLFQLSCDHCGLTKRAAGAQHTFDWSADNPGDSIFRLPLWMQTQCCGHSLWLYNRRHLEVLEAYINAELRQRRRSYSGWANASMVSRLPRWITAAKNREELVKALARLRSRGGFAQPVKPPGDAGER